MKSPPPAASASPRPNSIAVSMKKSISSAAPRRKRAPSKSTISSRQKRRRRHFFYSPIKRIRSTSATSAFSKIRSAKNGISPALRSASYSAFAKPIETRANQNRAPRPAKPSERNTARASCANTKQKNSTTEHETAIVAPKSKTNSARAHCLDAKRLLFRSERETSQRHSRQRQSLDQIGRA